MSQEAVIRKEMKIVDESGCESSRSLEVLSAGGAGERVESENYSTCWMFTYVPAFGVDLCGLQ